MALTLTICGGVAFEVLQRVKGFSHGVIGVSAIDPTEVMNVHLGWGSGADKTVAVVIADIKGNIFFTA
jgi:hypothetical protein